MFCPDAQPSRLINRMLVDQLVVRMPNSVGRLYNRMGIRLCNPVSKFER